MDKYIFNPLSRDFDLYWDGALVKTLPAHKAVKLPQYLYEHAKKHLIDELINQGDYKVVTASVREKLALEVEVNES